jgi:hypothetical protein
LDYLDVPAPASAYVALAAFNGEFVDKVITAESSGNAKARPRDSKTGKLRSSAYGAGQFIEATWLEMVKKHRPDLAAKSEEDILDLRGDFELSREMTIKFAEENRTYLIKHGFDPTDATLYLAHFAGRTGAVKLLKAHRDTPVEKILSPEAVEANQFLKGQTPATLYAWAGKKMDVEVIPLNTCTAALEQMETLRAELTRKLSIYSDRHPDIKALRNQIAALEALKEKACSTKRGWVSSSAKVTPHAEIPGCSAKLAKDDAKLEGRRQRH